MVTISPLHENVTLTDLAQIFEGGGLFSDNKNIFIEQIITKKTRGISAAKKKSGEFGQIVAYLEKNAAENTIFLWEGKELDRSALSLFKTALTRPFKLPQTLFLFLDSLKPGNGKALISLFHQTIETTETEMVFFMLVRQIRLLLALSEESNEAIDEIKRLTWQKNKLQQQAKYFGKERLKDFYAKLFTIEVGQKTGTLSSPLISTIDFLLLEI
jgi:hypothetical protein